MHEADIDARVAEVIAGLMRLRRHLDADTYGDLIGSVMVEIETGEEILVERSLRRPSATTGVVVPFPRTTGQPDVDGGGR